MCIIHLLAIRTYVIIMPNAKIKDFFFFYMNDYTLIRYDVMYYDLFSNNIIQLLLYYIIVYRLFKLRETTQSRNPLTIFETEIILLMTYSGYCFSTTNRVARVYKSYPG